jgi:S-DNA-T family DNA segregation ATPase FtsK/SpoIIIE
VPLKKIFPRRIHKYRKITLAVAVGLGAVALLLGFSIAGSLFAIPGIYTPPGDFFTDSYGILAFIIPLYLLWAAVLLAEKGYHPEQIFILSASLFPFMTLAIGFAFIRDYPYWSVYIPLITLPGKTGFGFLVVAITFIEGLVISALVSRLFLREEGRGPGKKRAAPRKPAKRALLPEFPVIKASVKDPHTETAFPAASGKARQPSPDSFPRLLPEPSAPKTEAFQWQGSPGTSSAGADSKAAFFDSAPEPEALRADEGEEGSGELSRITQAPRVNLRPKAETLGAESGSLGTEPRIPRAKSRGIYTVPVEGILNQYPDGQYWIIDQETRDAAIILKETLEEFKIQAEVTGIRKGPVITMFEILPAPGVKLSRIVNLQDNIALRLAASSVRIVAPIPGKHAVGIEVPNVKRNIVSFRELIEGELQRDGEPQGRRQEIPVVLGKDITGEAVAVDLALMPHLLIAGATGSGKSVCVNTMILSLLYQRAPAECRLILIDPKIVELKLYNDIPHLLTPVITEPKRAFQALQYCIYEMERRYACLDSMGVRDIRSYNKRIRERGIATEHMPFIVVVIDEFADLMVTTGKELESTVARLAAMSRAVGIHLVLATQRPSIDVITGLIKANIPSRIAFMVASKMDSRIIIDMVGAEKLLGKGDMLYAGVVDPFPVRMQGAFVSEEEVERVVEYVKTLGGPNYIDEEIFYDEDDEVPAVFSEGEDPLYEKALEVVVQQGKASASYIQRRLKIGYNRAARLVEEMEHNGVVGPAQGSKPRELLRGV